MSSHSSFESSEDLPAQCHHTNYLDSFNSPLERQDQTTKQVQTIPPVHYVKSLENPQVYIGALGFACVLYWCDRRWDALNLLADYSCNFMALVVQQTSWAVSQAKNLDGIQLALIALIILLLIVLCKRDWHYRQQKAKETDECEVIDPYPLDFDEKPSYAHSRVKQYIRRITPGEYEY